MPREESDFDELDRAEPIRPQQITLQDIVKSRIPTQDLEHVSVVSKTVMSQRLQTILGCQSADIKQLTRMFNFLLDSYRQEVNAMEPMVRLSLMYEVSHKFKDSVQLIREEFEKQKLLQHSALQISKLQVQKRRDVIKVEIKKRIKSAQNQTDLSLLEELSQQSEQFRMSRSEQSALQDQSS